MNELANPFDATHLPEGTDPFAIDLGSDAAMSDPFAEPPQPIPTQATESAPEQTPAAPVSTQQQIPVPPQEAAPVSAAPTPANATFHPQYAAMPAQLTPGEQPDQSPAEFALTPAPSAQSMTQPATSIPESVTPISATAPEDSNPLLAAMEKQEQVSIFAKPPVFEYGSVTEDITDAAQTFEMLRIAKSEDFPELEDEKRVTWSVTYGKVSKTVSPSDAKKKKIGEFKTSIETAKEFTDGLKTSKDKSPRCVLKPRVTAQSKGDALALPVYKGVFTNINDAYASGKPISIVPGDDGHLYEIRRNGLGTFTTRTVCKEFGGIRAGFTPALPRVPLGLTLSVIGFFRSFISGDGSREALVNILWDKLTETFVTYVPPQTVTRTRVTSDTTDMPESDRYLHYMDIHSHNTMPAKFSRTDDDDEKATRVYAVFGRLDRFMPDISVRISNGGKFLEIDPSVVFEPIDVPYPESWNERVSVADSDVPHDMTCIVETTYMEALPGAESIPCAVNIPCAEVIAGVENIPGVTGANNTPDSGGAADIEGDATR